jgi:transcriptional antiterminator NusG
MKKWYVVHTQTGIEEKVKASLDKTIAANNLGEVISNVIIPTEQVSEIRSGKKKISQRKFFPGYLRVEMDLSEETYLFIKNSQGVTGFIGLGRKPVPLPQDEVDSILKRTKETAAKPSPKVVFDKGSSQG